MKQLLLILLKVCFVPHIMRYLNRHRVTMLMLHGVAQPADGDAWQPLWPRPTPDQLDRALSQLAKHYQFIPMDDAVDMLSGRGKPIANAMVVTFDDGYRNNVTEALPVLKKHQVPGVFYIATSFVETGKMFWIDRLDFALQKSPQSERVFEFQGQTYDLRNLDRQSLAELFQELRLKIKGSIDSDAEMLPIFDAMSEGLEKAAGTSLDKHLADDRFAAIASWQQLKEAEKTDIKIGSHTVNHNRLTAVNEEEVAHQLAESRQSIIKQIGNKCLHFCYPNGDFNESIAEQVRQAGYQSAVTTQRGLNSIGDNLMTLRRFPMPFRASSFENLLAVSGFFELPLIRRFLD